MNPIKLIPFSTREAIRRALFGKNHFHDLIKFAVQIGCRVAFDVGAQRGYESILFAKAGMKVAAFEPDVSNFTALKRNIAAEKVEGLVEASRAIISDYCGPGSDTFILSLR
ncbi:MAG: hypothetical protein IPH04_14575, partial [Saprospirales bacterium]|nr:hypothetical protein [Saprospirales bacterium]